MLQGVPWFILGALWAILFCEYRAFRLRLKWTAHIRALESRLAASAEDFENEFAYNDRIRAELLAMLAMANSARARRATRLLRSTPAE
jgi:hypothetical protein